MITRPLDIASHLQPPPRSMDWLFYVNGGLIVLFFFLFGSRFVLAPGLGVDFRLPEMPEAQINAAATTHFISVKRGGIIFASGSGALNLAQLREWLHAQAQTVKTPVLLVRASADVPVSELVEIYTVARQAGFAIHQGAEAPPASDSAGQ